MLTAQVLQTKRLEHKMTTKQLAQALNVEESLISRYESGEIAIPAEHEAQLLSLLTDAEKQPRKTTKKTDPSKTPSVNEWLQNIAHEQSVKSKTSSLPISEKPTVSTLLSQTTAQIVGDKQRRQALNGLLTAALSTLNDVFADDKQIRGTAETIEALQPAQKQLIIGLIEQLELMKLGAQGKSKQDTSAQLTEVLKGNSPYETLLNYLEAATLLLKQTDIADRPPLMLRLQQLTEFDRSTVNMMVKRYQGMKSDDEALPPEKGKS